MQRREVVAGQGVCIRGEAGASVCTAGPRCMPHEQQTLVWPVAQMMREVTRRMEAVVVLRPRHWQGDTPSWDAAAGWRTGE